MCATLGATGSCWQHNRQAGSRATPECQARERRSMTPPVPGRHPADKQSSHTGIATVEFLTPSKSRMRSAAGVQRARRQVRAGDIHPSIVARCANQSDGRLPGEDRSPNGAEDGNDTATEIGPVYANRVVQQLIVSVDDIGTAGYLPSP